MRCSLTLITMGLLAVTSGCGDFEEAMNSERKPVSPPGILQPDQMGGDIDDIATGDTSANGNPVADGNAAPPADPEPPKTSIIGKTTAKVVDKKKAMAENPNLVVVENKLSGSDPVSIAGSAYISMSSRISVLNFQNNLKTWKALNDNRNPSYEEFTQMSKDLTYAMLPPYQMYGYDEETGGLVILEDKADKKKRYEAAGIPVEE